MEVKLYRSNSDKMLAGVCAGLAEYFSIDASIVRFIFVVLTFAGFSGVLAYIIAMLIIPERPMDDDDEPRQVNPEAQKKTKQIIGIVLVAIGALSIFGNIFAWIDFGTLLAIVLIGVGIYLIGWRLKS